MNKIEWRDDEGRPMSAKCEKRPAEFLLSLTEDEARAVCVALGHFGGGDDDQTEAVFDALHAALGGGTDYLRYFEIVQHPGCVPYIARKDREDAR